MSLLESFEINYYGTERECAYEHMSHLPAWKFSTSLCSKNHPGSPPCFFPSDFSLNPGKRQTHTITSIALNCAALAFYHEYHENHRQLSQMQLTTSAPLKPSSIERSKIVVFKDESSKPKRHLGTKTEEASHEIKSWSYASSVVQIENNLSQKVATQSTLNSPKVDKLDTLLFSMEDTYSSGSYIDGQESSVGRRDASRSGDKSIWRERKNTSKINFRTWIKKNQAFRKDKSNEQEHALNIRGNLWKDASPGEIDRMTAECGMITDLVDELRFSSAVARDC